jgi:polyisoprenoid-binding protein YceI
MTTATAVPATAGITTWNIDPAHSHAEFKVKHMMISNVKGTFGGITGTLKLSDTNPEYSSVEATVPVSTINTADAQRDEHLKGADFFDVEKYPTFTFKSTHVTRHAAGAHKVAGELTLRGVTKTVTFDVDGPSEPGKDPWGNTRIGLSATAKINRKDFGLGWNAALETGGVLVGEDVTLTLEIQFIQA